MPTRMRRHVATVALACLVAGPTAAVVGPGDVAPIADDVLAGRHERAIERLAALAEREGPAPAFVALTRTLVQRGAADAARAIATGAARSWLDAGDANGAVALLEALAEGIGPRGFEDLYGRALVHAQRHPAAVPLLEAALARRPDDHESRYFLASALWESGRPAEAEGQFRAGLEAAEASPGGGDASVWRHQLARLLAWGGRYAEAVPLLEDVARRRPGAPDVALDLAQALDGAGRDALEAYQRAVALAPASSHAYYGLARARRRAGQNDAAREALATYQRLYAEERARTHDEGVLRARLDQGWDRLRRGDHAGARAIFESLADHGEALRGAAAVRQALGDAAGALALLERAVARSPDDDAARRALAALRLAAGGGGLNR